MTISDLERQLREAMERVRRAGKAIRAEHRGGELQELAAAMQGQYAAERALSRARGEPTCVSIDWQPPWSIGAPCPHVVSSGHRTALVYLVKESVDPGTFLFEDARSVDPGAGEEEVLALVEWERCYGYRFGGPNDEVMSGHPLYGKGLEGYRAHFVENSPWIATERATNSVHRQFRPEGWERRKHYLLLFHDDLFECIAEGWKVEVMRGSFRAVVELALQRVFESTGA